ncbi:MAG TPA: hypothetical protein IAC62_10260 [Candidatus Pelethocola excrementipullorum]|nr:hypothetical protein [Candidatus Pelethocola excrementipullorum]
MIDDILHSVGEAEEQADQMLKNVKEECQQIKDEAVQEVKNLWRKKKEKFQKDEETQRISVRQEEAQKDEDAKADVSRYIKEMREHAYEKSDQMIEQLVGNMI